MGVRNGDVELAVDSVGDGVPVVFVHGTTGSAADYVLVTGLLVDDGLRVVTYDRRGRGRSGDGGTYGFDLEVADLHAVLDAVGERAHLFGHSFGALLALSVAGQRSDLLSLTLYEPGLNPSAVPAEAWDEIDEADRTGDWDLLLSRFQPVAGMPADETAFFRSIPSVWDAFLDGARTAAREIRAIRDCVPDPALADRVTAPTQLLIGAMTDSPLFLDRLDEFARRLRADVRHIPGARHAAMATAPAELAALIAQFAAQHRPPSE